MSKNHHSSDDRPKPTDDMAHAEIHKTQQAAEKATTDAVHVATPEKVVVDKLPPKPNYPLYRVQPGESICLANINPNTSEKYKKKKDVEEELQQHRQRIRNLQERLYAENRRSLLIVLQAMDTGGKDGTIKHVFSEVNPQGCQVWSFKVPSDDEASHDFLWRYLIVFRSVV